MRICVCGGGNLGHVVAGFIAAQNGHEVSVLTRQPERWAQRLTIETPNDELLTGTLAAVSTDAKQVISNAEMVLLCLPGFSIHDVLLQIREYLKPGTAVGSVISSTGFFLEAMNTLPLQTPLFGFQRVPFISRIVEYGQRARLMGYKESLSVAIEQCADAEQLRRQLEALFKTPTFLLENYYEASLSNSNPLLHPARLYDLWKDWHEGIVYPHVPLFYEEWTEEAAQMYIDMDAELQRLLLELPVKKGSIPTVLDYYESSDAASLAAKLRSIEAFKGIKAPMKAVGDSYVPDFTSRYFTEDFPYGLAIVQRLAHEKNVSTPTIDRICSWGINKSLQ